MDVCAVIQGLSGERTALAAYVLRTLLGTLGLPHRVAAEPPADRESHLLVWYGSTVPEADGLPCVEIAALEPAAPLRRLVGEASGRRAVVLGARRSVAGRPLYRDAADGEPVVAAEGARVSIGVDLVGSAGFWLTGGEESAEGMDRLGRFQGGASPRAQAGLLGTPVVTDLMRVLWEAVREAAFAAGRPLVRLGEWPAGHAFAVLLSHDVDLWRKRTSRQLAKELLRSLPAPRRLARVARAFCRGPDPWSDLDAIADLEAARGMRSTFFLLAGRRDWRLGGVRVVHHYRGEDQAAGDAARRLAGRGWEVALHGSLDSFFSPEALAAERHDVEALAGGAVCGARQHFLLFDWPRTWRCQAGAGLGYDATLGYHDVDGYRAGFSFPFHPFDGRELPVLELPLVVMDGALLERQGLASEAAWQRVEGYLERTAADGGMLSLLWHNTHFCDLDAPGYRGVYERALDWIRDHGGWGAAARDVAAWWRRRQAVAMTVEQDGAFPRAQLSASEDAPDLLLELHAPRDGQPVASFEGCRGRVVGHRRGVTRCAVEALAGDEAVVVFSG